MKFIKDKVRTTCERLKSDMEQTVAELNDFQIVLCDYKKDNTPPSEGWKPYSSRDRFGGRDKHCWLHFSFTTRPVGEGKKLFFRLTCTPPSGDFRTPQGLVFVNGEALHGIDIYHSDVPLQPATDYDIYIYLYSSSLSDTLYDMYCRLVTVDAAVESIYYDLYTPLLALDCFAEDSEPYITSLRVLEQACNLLDLRRYGTREYAAGVAAASEYMDREYYHGVCGKTDNVVGCIGHTHIDVAWLWTLAQTCEKTQRSFATVLTLMKQFPEYKFMSSQPQLYLFVKENLPGLYEEIKKAVADGRWEVEGASWLEMDTNLTGGESLVRQLLFGKRFMKKEFGVDSHIMWLPDVFGYSAALPQILQKSGVDMFMTTKIAWNESNKLPFDSFYWEGLDGSRVFAMFATTQDRPVKDPRSPNIACTYNARLTPGQVLGTWERYQQKQYNNVTLMTFGHGDGGGGPTAEMLQMQRRLKYGIPGLPKTEIAFSDEILTRAKNNVDRAAAEMKRLPLWVGELYLEYHRGTYTSIAKNKKNNRKSEFALQKAEYLSVADMLSGGQYPQEKLNGCWQTALLNQFHDIIPGSSIFEVYEDSDRQYAQLLGTAGMLTYAACTALESRIRTEGGTLVYNPLPFKTDGTIATEQGELFVRDIPAHGWRVVTPDAPRNSVTLYKNGLENDFFAVLLDEKSGEIVSLYDKRNRREVLKAGEHGNRMVAYEDFPRAYDAWEISRYYKQKPYAVDNVVSIEGIGSGEKAGLVITKNFMDSVIKQTVWLHDEIARIDFETVIDWKEDHLLLKTEFPLDIRADKATYEVQFGNLQRPTHANTEWDAAKFEVCGHKWADIGDDGYGVSLLNDCKYGHSAEGSTLALTLLKCATYPNPQADKCRHEFTYSLYPHAGNFRTAGTIEQAYLLNQPLFGVQVGRQEGSLPDCYSLVSCDCPDVLVETVKKAEDGDDIVIRLYEAHDRRSEATLTFGFDFDKAYICDMLENEQSEPATDGRQVKLTVGNFEIITLRLTNPRL